MPGRPAYHRVDGRLGHGRVELPVSGWDRYHAAGRVLRTSARRPVCRHALCGAGPVRPVGWLVHAGRDPQLERFQRAAALHARDGGYHRRIRHTPSSVGENLRSARTRARKGDSCPPRTSSRPRTARTGSRAPALVRGVVPPRSVGGSPGGARTRGEASCFLRLVFANHQGLPTSGSWL